MTGVYWTYRIRIRGKMMTIIGFTTLVISMVVGLTAVLIAADDVALVDGDFADFDRRVIRGGDAPPSVIPSTVRRCGARRAAWLARMSPLPSATAKESPHEY